MVLTTGITWETYWGLTSAEVAALSTAAGRVARRRKAKAKSKGR